MAHRTVAFENVRIVTPVPTASGAPARGAAHGALSVIACGHVVARDGRIVAVGATPTAVAMSTDRAGAGGPAGIDARIDGRGRVLMPALVDCHTHACWAGNRWGEWEELRAGTPYMEILRRGGGIMSTVRAVREASVDALATALADRLERMRWCGTGAVEVKTGYGLDAASELKMLDAILRVRAIWPAPVVPTLLAGHAVDPGNARQLEEMLALLPRAAERHAGIAVDAFCERSAWSVAMCRTLFLRARELRLPIRTHVDQFHAMGGLDLALELSARSVDHLEASTAEGIRALAASETIGVALPVCGLAMDNRYADARALIDAGGALALATNWNPGSAPSPSVAFAAAVACAKMRLTPAEAITSITWNAACVLGIQDECGAITEGRRSDLILLAEHDERALVCGMADDLVDASMLGGDLALRRA